MACFHPNHILMREGQCRFLGRADFLRSSDLFYDHPGSFHALVPCGRCMGCRLDQSRTWADRMLLELQDNDYKAIFVTLTYNNASIPHAWHVGYNKFLDNDESIYLDEHEGWIAPASGAPTTLSVRDTQLFFKRLRKTFRGKRIRYFLAGEYGPKTKRPHYHAIIFGLTLSDFSDLRVHDFNNLGQPRYKSVTFQNIWSKGFCILAPVNWNTCSYVSRYTMKKVFKSENPSEYTGGRIPPFCTMSRRPGIGLLRADELLKHGDKAFVPCDGTTHEIYLGRPFLRASERLHLKTVFDASTFCSKFPVEVKKVVNFELPVISRLHARITDRACNSIQRTISNLAVLDCNVSEFYGGKEKYFLDRLKLLPERGDLFEYAKACESS